MICILCYPIEAHELVSYHLTAEIEDTNIQKRIFAIKDIIPASVSFWIPGRAAKLVDRFSKMLLKNFTDRPFIDPAR